MLDDYIYAIRTAKQAGDYNKITNYLILHIRKTYKYGGDITDMIENQEPFNFNSSEPILKILTTVTTMDRSPAGKLEVKHENDQYRIEYKAELQLHLKQKCDRHTNQGKAYTFLFGQCTTDQQHRIEARLNMNQRSKAVLKNSLKHSRKIPCLSMTRRRLI